MGRSRRKKPLLEQVLIEEVGSGGKSLGRVEGKVVFAAGVVPGDRVDIQVTRKRKAYMEGHVTRFHEYSPHRTEPFCSHFGTCGGCKWQMLPYEMQLRYKQQQVRDQLERIGRLTQEELNTMNEILPSPCDRYYRNKMEYTFSAARWLTFEEVEQGMEIKDRRGMGFHIPGKFDKVLDLRECHLQPEPGNSIRQWFSDYSRREGMSYFDLKEQKGFLRTLIVRTSLTGEVMVILTACDDRPEQRKRMFDAFLQEFPYITSLLFVHNRKGNDTIYDQEIEVAHGRDHIFEEMGGLKFKVGPKSFYQTNPRQAHELYRSALTLAGLTGKELVYDLYTGTGTIACFLSSGARRVVGIESVPEAIEDAAFNASLNGLDNLRFLTGDMSKTFTGELFEREGKPEVVILDPPRAGMAADVAGKLLQAAPQKIVYISCNPATQARDLEILREKYRVGEIRPVDMFPQTHHVENVVLLNRHTL